MNILLFHPTLLPPRDYGGVERVVLWLAKGLLERGHSVTVAAFRGSQLPRGANLLEVDPSRSSALDLIEILPPRTDVIHFMAPPGSEALERLTCASLLTVHGNGKPGEVFPKNTVFLSADHAARHGGQHFVYNGVDPDEFKFNPKERGDWFVFLAKTSWKVKNVRGAIRYCARAKVPLKVMGGDRPLLARAAVSLKQIRNRDWQWIGPVAGERKAHYLSNARGLVFPILWDEPFGLVVVESLLSGTPVFATPRGSMPELVGPKVGALPQSDEEWQECLRSSKKWDPQVCRDWAMQKFHYRTMAEGYEKLYQRVTSAESLQSTHPASLIR